MSGVTGAPGHDGHPDSGFAPERFRAEESVDIDARPETVFDIVTDVRRTPEWSPVVAEASLREGTAGDDGRPTVGSVIVGVNRKGDRTWTTESRVDVVERPSRFVWTVAGGVVTWGYRIDATDSGCSLTETWHVNDEGFAFFRDRYGDDAAAQLELRRDDALSGIPATLDRIRRIAEAVGADAEPGDDGA